MRYLLLCLVFPLLAQESLDVSKDLRSMTEAHLTRLAEKQWKERAARVAAISTKEEVTARQQYIREKMLEGIGGLPTERTPLNARVTGTLERKGYRIEKVIFESLPGFKVTAALFMPTLGRPPYPAVLGVAGHSDTGKAHPLYQTAWAAMSLCPSIRVRCASSPARAAARISGVSLEVGGIDQNCTTSRCRPAKLTPISVM